MSHLNPGDEDLHYEDGSHRWSGGEQTPEGQKRQRARVQSHKEAHLAAEKGAGATWWPGRLQRRRKPVQESGE